MAAAPRYKRPGASFCSLPVVPVAHWTR